jgi:hypothetical protein
MLGRRGKERGKSDRRDLPRPSLGLNFFLIAASAAALIFAAGERRRIDAEYSRVLAKASAGSPELNEVKAELAEMDLTKETLNTELDSRLAYLEKRKSRDFFLSIDTSNKRLSLNFGNDTVRDANVQVGSPIRFEGPNGKTLSLAPLKGAFNVAGKVENGLGRYVILLPNDYIIHSPPTAGRREPKPGSFMVSEADLKAIWDRITPETRVYIF